MNKNNIGLRLYTEGLLGSKELYPKKPRYKRNIAQEGDALRRKLKGKRILEART